MKIAGNLQDNIPKEIKVFTEDNHNPLVSLGTKNKLRLKGIKSNLNGGLPVGCNSTEARLLWNK